MVKFLQTDNRLVYANENNKQETIDEKQAFCLFAENLREIRAHCHLTLMQLAEFLEIPNQTLSSYENKTHTPSMIQALKIAAFFNLTIEEFILCGIDGYPYDIIELYEKRKRE